MHQKNVKVIQPEVLLSGYAKGIFPMAEDDTDEVHWYTAIERGVIPMDAFKVSKNVTALIKKNNYEVSIDTKFREVMNACADRDSTWISPSIIESYVQLHELGFAHSVEISKNGKLMGGLYGVKLGRAFFGESMFKYEKEMDKIALFYCHKFLKQHDIILWDTQFWTEHLSQFGCIKMSAENYQKLLEEAIS